MRDVPLTDDRGRQYVFAVHPMRTLWPAAPGNYAFAQEVRQGATLLMGPPQWHIKYIGTAESLHDRLRDSHEQWEAARRLGATHVLSIVVNNSALRLDMEAALIRHYKPVLNVQHNRPPNSLLSDLFRPRV